MLKDLINKKVTINYETGVNCKRLKGIITKVNHEFITIDNKILLNTDKIITIRIDDI